MFRNLKDDNSGIVLVTVIVMVLVMMIFSIGILGLNVSQVTTGEREVERIQAQQLAMGGWWVAYSNLYAGGNPDGTSVAETLDGKTFTINTKQDIIDPTQYTVDVTYTQD